MSAPKRRSVASLVALGTSLVGLCAFGASAVVARVGARELTVAEIQSAVNLTPPYQLRFLGKEHDVIRRAVLDRLVFDALLAEGARADGMAEREDIAPVLRNLMVTALRDQLAADCRPESFSEAEVKAYYDTHDADYAPRHRLRMSRILLETKEEAVEVIAELERAAPNVRVQRWRDLALAKSRDLATNKHAGDLQLVEADGTTVNKALVVDPALFAAADKLADGAFGHEPVKDGDGWSVVWRRAVQDTPRRELASEATNIRRELARARCEKKTQELVAQLREQFLGDYHPEVLDRVDVDAFGEVELHRRPGSLPRAPHGSRGSPIPRGEPGRLR